MFDADQLGYLPPNGWGRHLASTQAWGAPFIPRSSVCHVSCHPLPSGDVHLHAPCVEDLGPVPLPPSSMRSVCGMPHRCSAGVRINFGPSPRRTGLIATLCTPLSVGFFERVGPTCGLPDPLVCWGSWMSLMTSQPGKFKGWIKRALALDKAADDCASAHAEFHKTCKGGEAMQEAGLQPPGSGDCREMCMLCKKAFRSRLAWASHAARMHQYRAISTKLAAGSTEGVARFMPMSAACVGICTTPPYAVIDGDALSLHLPSMLHTRRCPRLSVRGPLTRASQ